MLPYRTVATISGDSYFSGGDAPITTFEEFYAGVKAEARAEGPEAVRDLRAMETRYALISSLMVARRRLRLTQQQLAERTGIAQTEISRIERGRKSPTVDTYSRLAAALNLTVTPEVHEEMRFAMAPLDEGPVIERPGRGQIVHGDELGEDDRP